MPSAPARRSTIVAPTPYQSRGRSSTPGRGVRVGVGRKLSGMDATIEIRRLRKRYGRTVAVDDLSFTVRPGQVTGFVGPNGAGKSTTMRIILGLDRPEAGTALVGGRAYRRL